MKQNKFRHVNYLVSMTMAFSILFSCSDNLDRLPTNGISNTSLYSTMDGYKESLATLYSTLSEGYFLREYWNMQEIPTDEAVMTWDDPQGTYAYNQMDWTSDNSAISSVYTRLMYNITLCNNFIIESGPGVVVQRGYSGEDAATISTYYAEARFLRAYFYWMMLDLFGNPPFATEETLIDGNPPEQINQSRLFDYIASELQGIDVALLPPKTNEYGRADQAAAWSLLARLYLNAEVYTGKSYYTEAITYCKKIMDENYALESNYNWLMLGDNNLNTHEFIFTANYDNARFITWGGTNYLALGAAGVSSNVNGMSDSWNSLRITPSISALFPSADTTVDKRAEFWTSTQSLEIDNVGDFSQGYSTYKFRNLDRSGNKIAQDNVYNNISDIDFPVFRLAEIYLVYAESVLRSGSGGDFNTALSLINKIRGRAYANDPESNLGNITSAELDLGFILDERARELYWEGFRRTDLIRYKMFTTSDYLWAWKGGVKGGGKVDDKYNLFPLPTSDVLANINLIQNKDY